MQLVLTLNNSNLLGTSTNAYLVGFFLSEYAIECLITVLDYAVEIEAS